VEIVFKLLLILHLGAMAFGVTTNLVMPVFAAMMRGGSVPEALPGVVRRFALQGRLALLVLVLTGASMLGLRYGGDPAALGPWFLLKLAIVALLVVLVALQFVPLGRRIRPAVVGMVVRAALAAIVVLSVVVFG
jgi:hypothetical protein